MKKTKLLTIALSVPALAGVTAPLLLLTSCGDKNIELNLKPGEHVISLTVLGEAKTNQRFIISCEFEHGWTKIDKDNTKITAGNKQLKLGEDYEINNSFQITILPNKIKSTTVEVEVKALPTFISYGYEFVQNQGIIVYDNSALCIPGNTIDTNNLKIWGLKGDDQYYPINFGTGSEDAKLYQDGKDITAKFIENGIEITKDMVKVNPTTGVREISDIGLQFHCNIDGYGERIDLSAYAGLSPSYIGIKQPEGVTKYVVNEQYQFEPIAPNGAWPYVKFEIVSAGTTATATIDEYGELIATTAGNVSIKATSYFDETKSATLNITIQQV